MNSNPEKCPSFETCSAMLCPLDPDLKGRTWFADEDICRSRTYGQRRWVRKQRSIQKRQTKSWLERPVTYDELFNASRPKQLTDEQRQAMAERLAKSRLN